MINRFEKNIYFDESGKGQDYPILMGALSIPKEIYDRPDISTLDGTKAHWVDFKRKADMELIIKSFAKYNELIDINVINYDYQNILSDASERFATDPDKLAIRTIYGKFPERIFYGLLRNNPKHNFVEANVIIEEGTEYDTALVKKVIEEDLNIQSMYRGESFVVKSTCLKPKGIYIGLEMTDLILGIMRSIIKNENSSNRQKRKNKFIIEILKDEDVYNLFTKRISFYEWTQNISLREVDFKQYISAFIAKNHDLVW